MIYLKYSNQLNINKEKLNKRINQFKNKTVKKYRLSEIVFNKRKDEDLEKLIELINTSILNVGFNNTLTFIVFLKVQNLVEILDGLMKIIYQKSF